jgi:peptidoglycan/xylan/chitin deacetylase (PgdA/CDA1 family)
VEGRTRSLGQFGTQRVTMKKFLKVKVLSALRKAGAFPIISALRSRQNKLLILCYHGIALRDEHEWLSQLYITPDHFRRRLEMLKASDANVISLNEGIKRLQTHSLPPRSVVITFDDGFHDFYRHAFPLLHSFQFPCTVYLSTHYCRYGVPVFNLILNYMLWKSGMLKFDFEGVGILHSMPGRDYEERSQVVQAITDWTRTRKMNTSDKDEVARDIASRLGIDYDDLVRHRLLQMMNSAEVKAVANAGVSVELHTHRHRVPKDRDLFEREVNENREHIREFTGTEAFHFCYPSGEYAYQFLPWLRDLRVKSATTCESGLAARTSEALLLPRFLDSTNVTEIEFESWLFGVGY